MLVESLAVLEEYRAVGMHSCASKAPDCFKQQ